MPPIFAAKFANCPNHRNILAIANEDGTVAIQNTDIQNDNAVEQPLVGQKCHNNAVFDVEWSPGQMQLVSASGKPIILSFSFLFFFSKNSNFD